MGYMKDFDRRIRQGGDDAIAAVSELMPQWIPVSERLPDRSVNVLVWIPTAGEKTFMASLDDGGMWFSSDPTADAYSLGEYGAPTHWMPLPEPPSTKGNDDA